MAKVEIIGPKNLFFDVVSLIHEQGRLHIEDLARKIQSGEMPLDRMEVFDQQLRDQEQMEEMLIRVRAILKALHRADTPMDPAERRREYERLYALEPDQLADEIVEVIGEVEEKTSSLAATHTSIEGELALLARYEPILQKIQPLAKQIVTTGAYESVALLVERRYKSALEQLKEELDKLTHKQCEIVSTDVDEDTTAAIVVFNKTYSEPVHKFLAMENVNQIRLPNEFQDMPFDVAYDELKARRKGLPDDLSKVTVELERMSLTWQLRLSAIRDVLIDRIEEINAIPKFGRTEYAFVINGWIPVADVDALEKGIKGKWGDDIIITQTAIREDQYSDTPVAVKNPKSIAPFTALMGVRGVPRYGTIDPTWMLFIFFPLFYGMIVGDFGYGAVMLGVIFWLRHKFRGVELVQVATSILGPAATMVVAFGLLYGEGFGDMPLRAGWVQHVYAPDPVTGALVDTGATAWFGLIPTFHRVEQIMPFMIIALVVGVLHVLLGLTIGVVNALRTKHKKHLQERGGILTMLLAILVVVGVGQTALATDMLGETGLLWVQAGIALVALGGFVFAIRGGGVMGVVETLESFAHIASYIRIMAVGLAGALFADAINQIMTIMGNPIIGIFVGIVLHSLHIVMASFSPLIHALRLNLLEFFGKFYETGSQPYSPFMKTGGEESA
jgi:V/A-type H+-transporting ATPase subunit I